MRRIQLFEFTDQAWYPQVFRRIQTDYLQFVATRGAGHQNLVPLFEKALKHSQVMEIVDLCSGGTGPWLRLQEHLESAGLHPKVTLTDRFPSPEVMNKGTDISQRGFVYLTQPVDALNVPQDLRGMRTMFEGFHHFKPDQARLILKDAYEKRVAIGIFEASLSYPLAPFIFLLSPVMTLLGYIFSTPFILPRTWNRFLWTYLLPIVPLVTCWDGLVSFLRVYSPKQLCKLCKPLKSMQYQWEIGRVTTGTPLFDYIYLLGYPL